MEAHGFDTQRHMAIVFNGSLEKMSIMRSVGIGSAELSLALSEVFDGVPEMLFFFRVFMTELNTIP